MLVVQKFIFVKGGDHDYYVDKVNSQLLKGWVVKNVTAQRLPENASSLTDGGFLVLLQKQ